MTYEIKFNLEILTYQMSEEEQDIILRAAARVMRGNLHYLLHNLEQMERRGVDIGEEIETIGEGLTQMQEWARQLGVRLYGSAGKDEDEDVTEEESAEAAAA